MSLIESQTEPSAIWAPIEPPWMSFKQKGGIIEWFKKNLPLLETLSQSRITTQANNLLWYTGEFDRTLEYRVVIPGQPERPVSRQILPRIFNHLFDITEQRVSRLARLSPAFEVMPTNKEENDRIVARLLKLCLDAASRRAQMDFLMQSTERWNAVFGEVFIGVDWNPKIGDRKKKDSIERVGDVDIYLKEPWTILPQPKTKWEDVTWVIDLHEVIHIEEARQKFNMPKLEADGFKYIYNFNQNIEEKRTDEVVVYKLIVRPNEYYPDGRIVSIVNNTIVDDLKKYPYSHQGFPFERHTDIDVPGRQFPISFYNYIKPVQHVYNKLTSIITRNILLTAHPHVVMPKGSAKHEAFGNGPTFIEYQGPEAPRVLTFPSVSQEVFQFREGVRGEIGQVSGVQGVSRGDPPSGSRSASMLKFYEEQEQMRASTQIIKHNELIRRVFLKAGSIIGDYYPVNGDERLMRVVGKENQYMIESFKGVKISSEYDVVIVNSTGFSESIAGRIEEIKMIQEFAPGLLTPEQIADVLQLKNPQRAYDIATSALKKADWENQLFLDGKDVPPPGQFEDLIVHWREHQILFNSPEWVRVPEKAKEKAYLHQKTTERFMEDKAKANQAFAQQLASLPGYPGFWVLTPSLPEDSKDNAAPAAPPAPMSEGALPPEGIPPEMAMGGMPEGMQLPNVPSPLAVNQNGAIT